jgi:hypothetical protein
MHDDVDPSTHGMSHPASSPEAAWADLCARLASMGERILGPEFPGSSRDRAEGIRHLANQTVAWLGWNIGYDAAQPAFFRQNDLVVRWGGPNVDQTSRRARIEPDAAYRITGTMGACDDFILTMKNGDMFMDRYGVHAEVMASELGLGPGDDVDIRVGGPPHDGAWLAIPEGAELLNIREYYWDWTAEAPALLTIERLDTTGTSPAPIDPASLSVQLAAAATMVERSTVYWNDYVAAARAELAPNVMGAPRNQPGGSSRITYSFGFWDLGPDEALLIEADPAGALYWDVQLYSLGWFESLDFANRTTSLNHTQGWVHPDGRFRAVLTAEDPRVVNWLDNEGRPGGMVTFRWIRPAHGGAERPPAITATVVAADDLDLALPSGTPAVDAAARRAEIRARQRHAAWRYRA